MRRALVAGLGASGLLASMFLARRGWRVTGVGRGTPASAMSTGCIKGSGMDRECLEEIVHLFREQGMPFVGGAGSRTGVTNLGTLYECSLSPPHSTWTEDDEPSSITVLGVEGHPSLRPVLAASVLGGRGYKVKAQKMAIAVPPESSLTSIFHDEGRLESLVSELKESWGEAVLLPALFPLSDYGRLDELERRSGRRLLEAITPLGLPGQRFLNVLEIGARDAGAQLLYGRKVTSLEVEEDRVVGAELQGGLESRHVETDALLLSTGGPLGDGMLLENEGVLDPFNIFHVTYSEAMLQNGYSHVHGRLLSKSGTVMGNVFGAGDCLSSPKRLWGQGLDGALDGAWRAVRGMEVP